MSENDYIAEYIKERRPEIINCIPFFAWKMGRMVRNMGEAIAHAMTGVTENDINKLLKECEEEVDDTSKEEDS
jgi:demethoxyubiquinone hydroxylase (CLK1/Coq7/Cat5 family)